MIFFLTVWEWEENVQQGKPRKECWKNMKFLLRWTEMNKLKTKAVWNKANSKIQVHRKDIFCERLFILKILSPFFAPLNAKEENNTWKPHKQTHTQLYTKKLIFSWRAAQDAERNEIIWWKKNTPKNNPNKQFRNILK